MQGFCPTCGRCRDCGAHPLLPVSPPLVPIAPWPLTPVAPWPPYEPTIIYDGGSKDDRDLYPGVGTVIC